MTSFDSKVSDDLGKCAFSLDSRYSDFILYDSDESKFPVQVSDDRENETPKFTEYNDRGRTTQTETAGLEHRNNLIWKV